MSPAPRCPRTRLSAVRAALLLGCGALGACRRGPEFVPPATEVPPAWSFAPPGAAGSWPAPEWWRAFRAPELNALVADAARGNTDLAAATARLQQAEAQAVIAGAPLFPALSANTSVGPTRLLNNTGRERHYTLGRGVLDASYEIDFWGKNRSAEESALASADAARYARDVVWLTTSSSIVNLYFQRLSLFDRLKIAGDNLARSQKLLHDTQLQESQGIVPHLAVVQQESVVAGFAAVAPPLRQQVAASEVALAILVGKLPGTLRLRKGSLQDVARPQVLTGQPSELLIRRPDVQQAEAELVAANADIRVARAQFFPSFSFDLSGGIQAERLAQGAIPALGIYSLFQNVTQPIFQGGALRGRLKQSKARYQELLAGNYRKVALSAFGDVEVALSAVRAASAEQVLQERAASLAQQGSGLAQRSLQGGTGTSLNLLLSQSTDYSAQDALAQARLAYLQSLVGLTKALGGGWKA